VKKDAPIVGLTALLNIPPTYLITTLVLPTPVNKKYDYYYVSLGHFQKEFNLDFSLHICYCHDLFCVRNTTFNNISVYRGGKFHWWRKPDDPEKQVEQKAIGRQRNLGLQYMDIN
jgi:hypothetical protein